VQSRLGSPPRPVFAAPSQAVGDRLPAEVLRAVSACFWRSWDRRMRMGVLLSVPPSCGWRCRFGDGRTCLPLTESALKVQLSANSYYPLRDQAATGPLRMPVGAQRDLACLYWRPPPPVDGPVLSLPSTIPPTESTTTVVVVESVLDSFQLLELQTAGPEADQVSNCSLILQYFAGAWSKQGFNPGLQSPFQTGFAMLDVVSF